MARAEFVDGWLVAQVLGEGAYGEVRLLVHAASGAAVALKAVQAAEGANGAAGTVAAREAALHRALRHRHVLRCLGERAHLGRHYLFLEYAQGGELFDRIEPDIGMPPSAARRYCRQLLSGLRYLHSRGVAHRDIKPENLLLDQANDLKISDFGMATLFRHGTRERLLSRICGTAPYCAPEVLLANAKPYRAPPADIWAAALVLLAMLAGELPWERADTADSRFAAWGRWAAHSAQGSDGVPPGPWRKLPPGALKLLRGALQPDARRRTTLDDLDADPWLVEPTGGRTVRERVSASQPSRRDTVDGDPDASVALSQADMECALVSYSQPAHAADLLLASQCEGTTDEAPASALAQLVRRMTRVWLRCGERSALDALASAAEARGFAARRHRPRELAIDCGGELRIRAIAMPCGGTEADPDAARCMLEFRRSRGCGLEFKRRFVELRTALSALAARPPKHHAFLTPPQAQPMDTDD